MQFFPVILNVREGSVSVIPAKAGIFSVILGHHLFSCHSCESGNLSVILSVCEGSHQILVRFAYPLRDRLSVSPTAHYRSE